MLGKTDSRPLSVPGNESKVGVTGTLNKKSQSSTRNTVHGTLFYLRCIGNGDRVVIVHTSGAVRDYVKSSLLVPKVRDRVYAA